PPRTSTYFFHPASARRDSTAASSAQETTTALPLSESTNIESLLLTSTSNSLVDAFARYEKTRQHEIDPDDARKGGVGQTVGRGDNVASNRSRDRNWDRDAREEMALPLPPQGIPMTGAPVELMGITVELTSPVKASFNTSMSVPGLNIQKMSEQAAMVAVLHFCSLVWIPSIYIRLSANVIPAMEGKQTSKRMILDQEREVRMVMLG
ncbi:hypothetical protein RUND412_011554, partial [Rhizina undulata]